MPSFLTSYFDFNFVRGSHKRTGFQPLSFLSRCKLGRLKPRPFDLLLPLKMADQLAKLDPAQLSKMPSMEPPPGVTVDFDGQNPLQTTSIAVTSVFIGLAFFFVAIRACTKMKKYSKKSWDDGRFYNDIFELIAAHISAVTCAIGLVGSTITPYMLVDPN